MMSKDEYLTFVSRIVTEVVPSEKTAFAVAGPQLADALYSNPVVGINVGERRPSEFQFLDTATQVLEFVGLMIGTFNTIRKLLKTIKTPRDIAVKDKSDEYYQCQIWTPIIAGGR